MLTPEQIAEAKAAEAAKADAAAKEAAAKKETKKDDKEETEEEDEGDDAKTEKVDKAYVAKLKQENKERRLENKSIKEKLDKFEKAFSVANGKDTPDPVAEAKKQGDAKMKRALLRSELASVARDAHDPAMLFKAAPELFADIDVDLDTEMVDKDALEAAVAAAREKHPFLFAVKGETEDRTHVKTGALPPDRGTPKTGKNFFGEWRGLIKQNRPQEARAYYVKHRAEILAQQKMDPKL